MTYSILAQPAWPRITGTYPVAEDTPLILVIDDSITVRKIVETTLRRAGFAVLSFPDGVVALRWLASPEAAIPALILLDIGLPKLDGYEVARVLRGRAELARTPIIMLSSRDGVLDRLKSRLAGAQTHLTKPFRTEQLIELARSLLGRRCPPERSWEAEL
jgi:twitching motility two-component system response regulator PilG